MSRRNPRLLAAAGLIALCLGTEVAHAPAAGARPTLPPSPAVTVVRVSSTTKPDHVPDIPGVTYPRTAPPDLIAPTVPEVGEDAPLANAEARSEPANVPSDASEVAAPKPVLEIKAQVPTLKLEVDLSEQRLTVIEAGETVHVWPISSGKAGHATKTGTFRPQWASRMWYSRQYDLAPMPHAVFFNGGIAFHATSATHLLGRPASHGCVRLSPANARALYGLIHRHGFAMTQIRVFGSPKVAGSGTRKGQSASERRKRAPENASNSPFSAWPFF